MSAGKWNVANIISLYRILALPFLLAMIIFDQRLAFTVLLIISLLSDLLDGIVARALKLQTELGAQLDSKGDMGTYLLSVIALFMFEFQFLKENYLPIVTVILLYLIEACAALIKFGKISSFHTLLCKTAAYFQGIFMVSLFLFGSIPWIFYTAIIISIGAYLEEITILILLPESRSNIKGVWEVLKNRK